MMSYDTDWGYWCDVCEWEITHPNTHNCYRPRFSCICGDSDCVWLAELVRRFPGVEYCGADHRGNATWAMPDGSWLACVGFDAGPNGHETVQDAVEAWVG